MDTKRNRITIAGITYIEHDRSVRRRKNEISMGGKVSEPFFACPGQFELTKKQIIDRYHRVSGRVV